MNEITTFAKVAGYLFVLYLIFTVPYEMQPYLNVAIGAAIVAAGVFYVFVPMKRVKGILHEDLPSYSKAFGYLTLPFGLAIILVTVWTEFGIITDVLTALIISLFLVSVAILNNSYRKRSGYKRKSLSECWLGLKNLVKIKVHEFCEALNSNKF